LELPPLLSLRQVDGMKGPTVFLRRFLPLMVSTTGLAAGRDERGNWDLFGRSSE